MRILTSASVAAVTALAPESMPDGHIRVPRTVEAD